MLDFEKVQLAARLKGELLFPKMSMSHSNLARVFALIEGSLEEEVRSLTLDQGVLEFDESASAGLALDSASEGFERLLGRLRRRAGFDSRPWHDPGEEAPWADGLRTLAPLLWDEVQGAMGTSTERPSDPTARRNTAPRRKAPSNKGASSPKAFSNKASVKRSPSGSAFSTSLASPSIGSAGWDRADYQDIAPDWSVLHLWQKGAWLPDAEARLPRSVAALRELEQAAGLRLNPLQTVACGVARQPRGTAIKPHCDGNLLGLTAHLGEATHRWLVQGGRNIMMGWFLSLKV
jgi:hypothetical protein